MWFPNNGSPDPSIIIDRAITRNHRKLNTIVNSIDHVNTIIVQRCNICIYNRNSTIWKEQLHGIWVWGVSRNEASRFQ